MTCRDCIHYDDNCPAVEWHESKFSEKSCSFFKPRDRFVELLYAEWIVKEDMYGDPVYCCSNCREEYFLEEWTPIENRYFYCPNCGAKMDEQALRERETK